jgi:biopolymer transport protein ExbB/TolQ
MAEIQLVLARAGWVGYALIGVSMALWSAVAMRWSALSAARFRRHLERVQSASTGRRAAALRRASERLTEFAGPIATLVAAAPLLGLLGTVGGMIELFDALHGDAAVVQGSVAAGISRALVTTQLGLVIGIPGLIAARMLTRRQLRLQAALEGTGGAP